MAVYLRNVVQHLVLARKAMVAFTFATPTSRDGAPEKSLFQGMGAVVVSMEVVPASEGTCSTSRERAAEDKVVGVVR